MAHVIVASDNRESLKRLTRALGSRPLVTIALMDADAASALNIVSSQLDMKASLSSSDVDRIGRLGGRSTDLGAVRNTRPWLFTQVHLIIISAGSQS